MTPERYQQLKVVFQEALEQRSDQRRAYLEIACVGDPALRRDVESLLATDEQQGQVLDKPLPALAPELRRADDTEVLGNRMGSYRLERLVKEGGMGAVYEAWRADDQYRQRVALKLIRASVASESTLHRFRQERQILAALAHPHIAHLLDGGVTPDGQPYLVMEYVEGQPIDEYCETHRIGIRDRIRLFQKVCSAVQYAHQNLIVHRDLKPSNILVTAEGTVKLLDFGIAKLLREEQDNRAPRTRTGMPLMTPEYASPEQVRGESNTTATDVYSLGVVLYELLTGRRPFRLEQRLLGEIEQIICEQEPPPPSTAVSTETATNTGAGRPERLRRTIAGDLDNIVLLALRKEPQRRYASVEQLHRDLQHYLDGLPVLAQKPTWHYRTAKFLRRHRAGVIAALVFVTLIGGIMATAWQARIAQAERGRAVRRFHDVRRLANTMLFEVHSAIEELPGATPARELLVRRGLEYLDSLTREAAGDPVLQLELASGYAKVGDIQWHRYYANLGDRAGALENQRKALSIRESVAAAEPGKLDAHAALARSYSMLGDLMIAGSEVDSAVAHYRRSLELRQRIAAADPTNRIVRTDLAVAYQRMGDTLGNPQLPNLRDLNAAEEHYGKMQAIWQGLLAEKPDDLDVRHSIAIGYEKFATVKAARGDPTGGLQLHRKELSGFQEVAALQPANAWVRRDITVGYSNVGVTLRDMGDLRGALPALRNMLKTREELAAAEARTYAAGLLGREKEWANRAGATTEDLNAYAWSLLSCEPPELRNAVAALPYARRAVELTEGKHAGILDTLAMAHFRMGDTSRAIQMEEKAIRLGASNAELSKALQVNLAIFRAALTKPARVSAPTANQTSPE